MILIGSFDQIEITIIFFTYEGILIIPVFALIMVKLAFNSQKQSCLRRQQPNHQHWQRDTWGSREGTVDVLTFYFSNDILVE